MGKGGQLQQSNDSIGAFLEKWGKDKGRGRKEPSVLPQGEEKAKDNLLHRLLSLMDFGGNVVPRVFFKWPHPPHWVLLGGPRTPSQRCLTVPEMPPISEQSLSYQNETQLSAPAPLLPTPALHQLRGQS